MENSEIIEALSGVFYLATTEDDQPHVRPFDKAAEVDGKIYLGTGRAKKVFSQILNNPKVEVFAMSEFGTCRFMAEAFEEEDEEKTKEAFEKMEKPFDPETNVAIRLENIKKA
ncbi:pyridoxamine 5'-phosphate oxidase family protein [Candidatus Saccharibacteria bacterium]|nr:pyridoxamine 5'-phosphate oxidase family protein [Candidatus Saccharibacteria bacterium]